MAATWCLMVGASCICSLSPDGPADCSTNAELSAFHEITGSCAYCASCRKDCGRGRGGGGLEEVSVEGARQTAQGDRQTTPLCVDCRLSGERWRFQTALAQKLSSQDRGESGALPPER